MYTPYSMNELLRYFRDLEYLIYIILGGFTVWQIRKFFLAWEELRAAAFGLEKESAQMRLNRSARFWCLAIPGAAEFGWFFYNSLYARCESLANSDP